MNAEDPAERREESNQRRKLSVSVRMDSVSSRRRRSQPPLFAASSYSCDGQRRTLPGFALAYPTSACLLLAVMSSVRLHVKICALK